MTEHKPGCPIAHIPLELSSCTCGWEGYDGYSRDVLEKAVDALLQYYWSAEDSISKFDLARVFLDALK